MSARAISASSGGDATMAVALVGVLALTVAPLPPVLFDLLLGTALCLAALTFLVAFYVERPTDFSSFPALLLFVTLFRLSLNVASTRLILTHGGQGEHAAGAVIAAFGRFAIGGDFVVGAIIFLILVIVNFVVITKGAERISEVAARFTLDSMPGKQMAIDADLGAGLISEKEARARRQHIQREADFHGAMDGASKFVRGDAVAGLLILAINVVGGIVIGVAERGMSFGEAARTFTLLSIGDGLVSQIPALLVSTGAALLITRSDDRELGTALSAQLLRRRRPLMVTAALVTAIGLLPGMPHLLFLALGGMIAWRARRAGVTTDVPNGADAAEASGAPAGATAATPAAAKGELEAALPVELLAMEVGLDLINMVDAGKNGELLRRIATLRKQLATELGVLVPPIHIRDDLRLAPGAYRVLLSGVLVAEGSVAVHRLLALDPSGTGTRGIPGEATTEPTFGLPAKWIATSERARAEAAGCTVVDPTAVIATHLAELIRKHAHELLGRREAQELFDVLGKTDGKVVEELIPHLMSTGDVIKVLRNLLREGVSIRDLRTILETLADHAGAIKHPDELTELVRQRLARRITRGNLATDGSLRPLVLDPRAEQLFREPGGRNARALSRLTDDLAASARELTRHDEPPLLVVAPDIRRTVASIAARHIPGLAVISFREVDPSVPFVTRGVITALEAV
ncbi:MAG: flagellar biosynthesis protein FlhA [Myxococcales bacterium]|nr:flagellar biosynthesis protein FlhA [Myxococcales bacterium]MBK7193182.1 flagellar biosynthesis protein FlhA [Myxococcales bacterium]MBP6844673.1 flagellar biosynthesis protein FlhA [Kofleriaceae bacterium]